MTQAVTHDIYEDTLECQFFSSTEISKAEWSHLCESLNKKITSLSKDYIWHRDEFKVVLPIIAEVTNGIPYHLKSTTCFGDNIEDEWFIVYILLEISKDFKNLIIKVEDSDGDFLLIEAADYLPAWVKPETTENRVFIFNQHIHIIPNTVATTESALKLVDAIKLVTLKPNETKASMEIEQAIAKRIGDYPQKFYQDCHKAILKLPLEIATILTLKPSLISPIVSTCSSLDAFDAKYCKNIELIDCVDAEVMFTKYLYAMLVQCKLPYYVKNNVSKAENKTQLGLKVACGYRIIMSQLSKDIFNTPGYNKFLNSLSKKGYFKHNLEGSLEYSELLKNAQTYYMNMECSVNSNACNTIDKLKSSNEFRNTKESLKQKNALGLLKEDDDNWLNVNPDELNNFLNCHYGKNVKLKNNDPITPHILTSELTDFLKETSDFEGIEQFNRQNVEDDTIDFNSEEFVKCVEKMLNLVSHPNNTYSDNSSDEEYDENFAENYEEKVQDLELAAKLKVVEKDAGEISTMKNFSQSMKEEGITGPASTILRQIGINKSDILDSDDDED